MQDGLQIRNVCVIGAGTMGVGIATHLVNLGFNVTILDRSFDAVEHGLERIRMAKPPLLFLSERINDLKTGVLEDSLGSLSEIDWVVEAVFEDLPTKQKLYETIVPHLRADALLTTNTSGLPISELSATLPENFQRRFCGTHFFNPPRYLKLLELIPGPNTEPQVLADLTTFLEASVGKRVVLAKDTPGFIANRYGMWCIFHAIHTAEKLRLTIEEVDAITGAFLGRPKSGTFRLADLIGIDVMRDIAAGLEARCPSDPFVGSLRQPESIHGLLARAWLGEKTGHGYTRKQGKELMSLDLTTFAYRPQREASLPTLTRLAKEPFPVRLNEGLRALDEVGEFLREYLLPTLRYAEYLREEISHNVQDFDRVMQWGFGWSMGPFALIDLIGAEAVGLPARTYYSEGKVLAGKSAVVPPPEPAYADLQSYKVIDERETLRLRDLGHGIVSIGLKTKMGVISPAVVAELTALLEKSKGGKYVLVGESGPFSLGFDLTFFNSAIAAGNISSIESAIIELQTLGELMDECDIVAAVRGYCLGAGLELALSCRAIVADSESKIGFPEAKVGLIPGGRGTVLARLNNQGSKWLPEVAMNLAKGEVSLNADHAHRLGYLRSVDTTSYHPDRLITAAIEASRQSTNPARQDWKPLVGPVGGMVDRSLADAVRGGVLSDYDSKIGDKIKQVFVKPTNYPDAIKRERQEFMDLCARALTQARVRHMVEHKTPLRN